MPVQDHIHLETIDNRPWSVDDAPDNTYVVNFPYMRQVPTAFVHVEYALTGAVHVHQLVDGSGDVMQRDFFAPQIKVDDTDFAVLKTEIGKKVDFVPHIHPNVGNSHSAYVVEMVVRKMQVREVNPMLDYYYVTVTLEPLE
jgi:hypothetical protein